MTKLTRQLNPDQLLHAIVQPVFIAYLVITLVLVVPLILLSRSHYGDKYILIDLGVCCIAGGYTVLSTKALSSLLSTMFLTVFRYKITWGLVAVLIAGSLTQVRFLNLALMRFQSKEVIPVQFVGFSVSQFSPPPSFSSGRNTDQSAICDYRLRRVVPRVSRPAPRQIRQLCLRHCDHLLRRMAPHLTGPIRVLPFVCLVYSTPLAPPCPTTPHQHPRSSSPSIYSRPSDFTVVHLAVRAHPTLHLACCERSTRHRNALVTQRNSQQDCQPAGKASLFRFHTDVAQ